MKRNNANKKYYALALLICLVLLVSACKSKSGASTGGAPSTPFIRGTTGITINFEKDSPPPEVTDDETFGFRAILRLKNDGEFTVDKDEMKINLVGFDPEDFGATNHDIKDQEPEDDLLAKVRDAEGNIIEGTTTFASFPIGDFEFTPQKFSGNTEFTFRAEVCYNYQTKANAKLCILKDLINIVEDNLCDASESKPIYSSSAPVQVVNFRETVVGKDKISFSFDISLSGNADIFRDRIDTTPASNFDSACPKDPRKRRDVESNVKVTVTPIPPSDPVITNIKCGGLDSSNVGLVRLVNNRRTITCTADLNADRLDLEKVIEVLLQYNVLDIRETRVIVKHLQRDDE